MAIIYTYPIKTTSANRNDLILISDSADKNKTKQISVAKLPGGIDFVGVGGNGTAGKIPKWSTQYDLTDSSIFEASVTGDIGIGTISPASRLHVYQNNNNTTPAAGITVEQQGTGDAVVQYLLTGSQRWVTGIDNSLGNNFRISSSADLGTDTQFSISTDGEVTIFNNLDRPVTIKGEVVIKGSTGGWATGYNFKGNSNTLKGGFGALGNADSLSYFYIGDAYNDVTMVVQPNAGNVGIGTTAPAAKLDILDTAAQSSIRVTNNSYNNYLIQKRRTDDTQIFGIKEFGSNGGLALVTGNTERLNINNLGNVGIGTDLPSTKLHVSAASSNSQLTLERTGTATGKWSINTNTDNLFFNNSAGSSRLVILDNGNVGIGTTAPDSILTVNAATANVGLPVIKGSVNGFANGFTLIGDNYVAGESQFNLGVSYSGANGVLSRSVKVSNTTDDVFLSSQDAYATNPNAFILDRDGSFRFLNTPTNASTPVGTAVGLNERMRIKADGKVGIGTTAPSNKLTVGVVENETSIACASTGFDSLRLGTLTFPVAAGYYRVAEYPTAGARGGARIDLCVVGGAFAPVTFSIDYFKSFTQVASGEHTLKLEQYGGQALITKARIAVSGSSTFVEVYKIATGVVMPAKVHFNRLIGESGGSLPIFGTAASGSASTPVLKEVEFAPKGTSVEALNVQGNTITKINFKNLPTAAAGLASGDIYNDGGTLKIVP